MDSQHRHELEENDLASWLEREVRKLKPHLPAILIGVIAIVGGILGLSAWSNSAQSQQAQAWSGFTHALEGQRINLNTLKVTADDNPGEPVEEWSLITWADGKLWNATAYYIRERDKSDTELAEAEETYQKLTTAKSGAIVGRAYYGLGRVYEMQGDLEKAAEHYGKVNGMFKEIAADRAENLSTAKVAAGYGWITQIKRVSNEAAAGGITLEADGIDMPAEEELDVESTLDEILSQTIDPSEEATGDRYAEEASSEEASPEETAKENTEETPATEADEAEATTEEQVVEEAVEEAATEATETEETSAE